MESAVCKQCASQDIEEVEGCSVCKCCGTVFEESFFETYDNNSSNYNSNRVYGNSMFENVGKEDHKYGEGAYRSQIYFTNVTREIHRICSSLRINERVESVVRNLHKRCASCGYTKRRKSALVYGACVYVACRLEQTSHLLSDVSKFLSLDVSSLGNTYKEMIRILKITLPVADASVLIMRFANQLDVGDKEYEISRTAFRLFKKLSMSSAKSGSHPSGFYGAALYLAAKLYDIDISAKYISNIVTVTPQTLIRRIKEYSYLSNLTLAEIESEHFLDEVQPTNTGISHQEEIETNNEEDSLIKNRVVFADIEIDEDKLNNRNEEDDCMKKIKVEKPGKPKQKRVRKPNKDLKFELNNDSPPNKKPLLCSKINYDALNLLNDEVLKSKVLPQIGFPIQTCSLLRKEK